MFQLDAIFWHLYFTRQCSDKFKAWWIFKHAFVANLLWVRQWKIRKIGRYLVKLWARVWCLVFDSQCRYKTTNLVINNSRVRGLCNTHSITILLTRKFLTAMSKTADRCSLNILLNKKLSSVGLNSVGVYNLTSSAYNLQTTWLWILLRQSIISFIKIVKTVTVQDRAALHDTVTNMKKWWTNVSNSSTVRTLWQKNFYPIQ